MKFLPDISYIPSDLTDPEIDLSRESKLSHLCDCERRKPFEKLWVFCAQERKRNITSPFCSSRDLSFESLGPVEQCSSVQKIDVFVLEQLDFHPDP